MRIRLRVADLGVDHVVTPMRRSQRPRHLSSRLDPASYVVGTRLPSEAPAATRNERDEERLAAVLDGAGYAYAPNPALLGSLVTTPLRPRPSAAGAVGAPTPRVIARTASVHAGRALLHAMGRAAASRTGEDGTSSSNTSSGSTPTATVTTGADAATVTESSRASTPPSSSQTETPPGRDSDVCRDLSAYVAKIK